VLKPLALLWSCWLIFLLLVSLVRYLNYIYKFFFYSKNKINRINWSICRSCRWCDSRSIGLPCRYVYYYFVKNNNNKGFLIRMLFLPKWTVFEFYCCHFGYITSCNLITFGDLGKCFVLPLHRRCCGVYHFV
jgi:hypothetical protein